MKGDKRRRDELNQGTGRLYGQTYSDNAQIWDRGAETAGITAAKETWVDTDFFASALQLEVSDQQRALGVSLTSILDRRDLEWTVKPTLETVDGADCHVLECKGFLGNRVWIDAKIGFSMRFRETYQPIEDRRQSEWPLLGRYWYREFEKIPPVGRS